MFEFLIFDIQFFQATSDGETTKTKVDIYNFSVENFLEKEYLIWS